MESSRTGRGEGPVTRERGRGDGGGMNRRGRDDASPDRGRGRGGDVILRGGRDGDRPWRSGRRYTWGPGAQFYFWNGYYYGDCRWLLRRAEVTGSRYWWRRYRLCRAGY